MKGSIRWSERHRVNELRETATGLYRVYWKSGEGSSLAAIGMLPSGERWLAPINWVRPTENPPWEDIERLVPIEAPEDEQEELS